ncbi:hypothetical protein [Lysinibacillus fusiformis]|uniref:hypothetical protein n=1 Tax=Lysinibacillus fusiformis TaxID=28031 RepID=UPI003D089F0C
MKRSSTIGRNSLTASGSASHAEGQETVAQGGNSHAEGLIITNADFSQTEGQDTIYSGNKKKSINPKD